MSTSLSGRGQTTPCKACLSSNRCAILHRRMCRHLSRTSKSPCSCTTKTHCGIVITCLKTRCHAPLAPPFFFSSSFFSLSFARCISYRDVICQLKCPQRCAKDRLCSFFCPTSTRGWYASRSFFSFLSLFSLFRLPPALSRCVPVPSRPSVANIPQPRSIKSRRHRRSTEGRGGMCWR